MPNPFVLLLAVVVLTFCGMIYLGLRAWRGLSRGKKIAVPLLLVPHLAMIVCIAISLACGHPQQGSADFNTQFACAVLIVFILPVPTLVGTLLAFVFIRVSGANRRPAL